jgi:hypothetical protein
VQPVERLLPCQCVDLPHRRHPAHQLQMVAGDLLPNDRSLPFGGVGLDHSRQEVESRFIIKNKDTARAPRLPLQSRPSLAAPAADGFVVLVDGACDRRLVRPFQLLEQTANAVLVAADAELFSDEIGDAGARPGLPSEPIRLRPVPEATPGSRTRLRRIASRWGPSLSTTYCSPGALRKVVRIACNPVRADSEVLNRVAGSPRLAATW